jgi:NAD(P)-dependent dehydrogenase (short-subunit alcohol dehydrogenase family)
MRTAQFSNKVCIVTGGASGIGRGLGERLASLGAHVILADINEPGAHEVAAGIVASGGDATSMGVDVSDPEAVRAMIERAVVKHGRIDYFFNNAGTPGRPGEIRDLTLDDWRRVIEVNLFGEIYGVHYVYPIMIRQGFGHIVNTASGFAMVPGPLNSPYVASKFALFGMTHALAIEARALGVDVSLVCPAFVRTPLIDGLKPVNADADEFRKLISMKEMPVERAVDRILDGVRRKRLLIAFPAYLKAYAFLHRYLPSVFMRVGLRQVEQFRKIRRPPTAS